MPFRLRAFNYFAILVLLCGMLMPSELVEKPISRLRQKHVETNPWSYQTHLAPDTWEVMTPSDTSRELISSRTQDGLRHFMSSNETAICVGEISGVDLEVANLVSSPSPVYEYRTIAHLRTLKALTANCPNSLNIYSPAAKGSCGDSTPVLACGDRVLILLVKVKDPMTRSKFSPVWQVLMHWHLKNSVFDNAQRIYITVGFGLDDKSMTRILPGYSGHLSAFCWREFETRGETLQEGIDALQALYCSAYPPVVHE